jgi:hypothetical protein
MATKKELQDNIELLREERNLLNEVLNLLKKKESTNSDLNKSQTDANRIQKDLNNLISDAERSYNNIADDLDATKKITDQLLAAETTLEQLKNKEGEHYLAVQGSAEIIVKKIKEQVEFAKELDGYGKYFGYFAKFVDKIPGLSALKGPFEKAQKASRKFAETNKKGEKPVSGIRAGLAGAKTLMSPTGGLIGLAGILVKLFLGADARTTALAKNLGISKNNASELSKILGKSSRQLNNLSINAKSLGEALSNLTTTFGASIPVSEELVLNQAFLTESLKLSGEEASNLSFLFSAFGGSATAATDNVIKLNKSLLKQNGFYISSKKLLKEIATTSAEIQGYFGFSEKNLAKAVYQTRKFGISLSTANGIASSLLDFETSLSNELKLELLTNKSLNFERARALAFTGDIAGASAAVLKQTQKLTKEQRKNPIILKAAADASGISVEELNKSFIIQKKLNIGAKEYTKLIRKGTDAVGFERAQQLLMTTKTREEYANTLSIQEKFSKVMTRVTESFEDLVNDGYINALVDGIAAFVTALGQGKGFFGAKRAASRAIDATNAENRNQGSGEYDDFTIRANPKDTLVMAGGTKLGSETNVLLKELITAVKTGGDVYIDGAKVGSSLVMAKTKLS